MKIFRFSKRKRPDLEKFHTEELKVDGHKLTVFTDPLKMPYKRILQYFIAVDAVRLGITREDQESFKTAVRHEINRGEWSKVAGLFEHFFAFTDLYAVEKNLVQLGSTFIMMEGEDPHEPTDKDFIRKSEAVERSEELKAFFLSRSYASLTKSKTPKQDFDISEYLKDPMVKKAATTFFELIHSPTYKSGSTN